MLRIKSSWKLSLIVPVLFLMVGIWTIPDYGFNSDEPFHFYRGQTYLHFLLTGNKDYQDLAPYPRLDSVRCFKIPHREECKISPPPPSDIGPFKGADLTYEKAVWQNEKGNDLRRSFFQHDNFTFNEIIKQEDGHPPLGGILAALTNRIFYQNLKIMPDVESHHLAEIILSFFVLSAVAIFTYLEFGLAVSLVAAFTIATYPLFFGESHFNIKDPVETAFFGLTLILFYFGIVRKKWQLLVLSALSAGMALGVKPNILFAAFILGPWLIFQRINKSIIWAIVIFPFIALLVFLILWPYLWPDPWGNIQKNIAFYKSSGLGTPPELKNFIVYKINTFPIIWILTTTPIPVLILSLMGIFYSLMKLIKEHKLVFLFLLLWLVVPIARVSLPNLAIYGGIRHIMEFILPLGMMTGLGAAVLWKKITPALVITILVLAGLFNVWELIRLHPNENVYFNQLIGGLKGAKEKKIPFWGNSYGNAYLQGVRWLNLNAEPGAKLGLPVATMANLPRLALRSDIFFNNGFWSGPAKEGEYEMEQTHDFPQKSWYSLAYYETYLNPVYELKVDNVPILKIWKNDLEHTRERFKDETTYPHEVTQFPNGVMIIDLLKEIDLTRLTIEHQTKNCQKLKGGALYLSLDGNTWFKESEPIDFPQVPPAAIPWDEDTFTFLFAGKKVRFIKLDTQNEDSCIFKNPKIEIRGLKL